MRATFALWLFLLCPAVVIGAEPYHENRSDTDERDGDIQPKVRMRVRVIEVSLTKVQNMGLNWGDAPLVDGSAAEVDGKLRLLEKKNVAKVLVDELIRAKDGSETRIRHGVDSAPSESSEVRMSDIKGHFQGTEIALTPRWKADGQLAIELVCKEARPASNSRQSNKNVQDISTVVELPPGEAIVIKGRKDQRVESTVKGFGPGWFPRAAAAFGKVTDNINEIQRFIVVSRDPPVASKLADAP